MQLNRGHIVCIACCAAIFLPGSLIFGFPGVMRQHWLAAYHVGLADIGRILFFVLAAVGIFMFLIGRLQARIGPAWVMALGAILGGASTLGVGYAPGMAWIYGWAFLVGSASAFVYLPTLTVVQLWYPQHRGLVSGLVSMSFGIAGAAMAPLYHSLAHQTDYRTMPIYVGIAVMGIGLVAAALTHLPQSAPQPDAGSLAQTAPPLGTLTVAQSLRTRSFWLLWTSFAFVGAAGISMVVLATHFGAAKGLTVAEAVLILMAFNLTNGASRLVSGYLSDITGRRPTMSLAFLLAGMAYWAMPLVGGWFAWSLMAAVIGFAFGTLFAVSAPLVGDCFGMLHFGQIFGLIFTAFGFVSGILGPWLSGYLLDIFPDGYTLVFGYLGGLMVAAALMIWLMTAKAECRF